MKIVKSLQKTKVVLLVNGGVVQSICSNSPDVLVKVIDYDNLKEEGLSWEELIKKWADETKECNYNLV